MKVRRASIIWLSIVVAITSLVSIALLSNWPWYASFRQIKYYLLKRTPLGSSEQEVISYLRESGLQFEEPWRGNVPPNRAYPPNTVAGSSYINVVVGEYWLVFSHSVEAFYIFDSDGRLVEIALRGSIDAM